MKSGVLSILFFGSLSIILAGCAKETEDIPLDFSSAIQLSVGNYWIYDLDVRDLGNGNTEYDPDDSTFIAQDTVLNNHVYYIFKNLIGLYELKTRVSGEVIDAQGNVEFSATNFKDTIFRDNDLKLYGKMKSQIEQVVVPAGKFDCVVFYIFYELVGHGHEFDPSNESFLDKNHAYLQKIWYAKNVGVIKKSDYYTTTTVLERQLKRYVVN